MNTPTQPVGEAPARLGELQQYLASAEAHGIVLRPITGLMLRLGDQFGIDIDAVGSVRSDDDGAPADEYYDQLSRAVWLLAEDAETLVRVAAEGRAAADAAFLRWRLQHFTSLEAEAAAMRAFVARWFEHRLEMARLYEVGESDAADA